MSSQKMFLGSYQNIVDATLKRLEKENFVKRLWDRDASLWKNEEDHQKIIKNSLGWLTVADLVAENVDQILDFAEEVKKSGIQDVVLLGMGGSSLASEVFRLILPSEKGYPKLHVLDSTDPNWVYEIEKSVNLPKTLFVFSSKSGTTTEPFSFYSYFFDRVKQNGRQFISITDPGTFLEDLSKEKGFLKTFLNPSDIGGRFSALSYFGIVPCALSGKDVQGLLESAKNMMTACSPSIPAENNPGLELGVVLGELAKQGRDKVTLMTGKGLESFGLWIEQLVAESSGKEGKGIVPIAGEMMSDPGAYGNDRLFIFVTMKNDKKMTNLMNFQKKDHPVVLIEMEKPTDLGGELFRWEIATAVACSVIGVDAFDQPNVQEAKDLTKSVLKELSSTGNLPELPVHIKEKKISVTFSQKSLRSVRNNSPVEMMKKFFDQTKTGDYFGILAFLPFEDKTDKELSKFRTLLCDSKGASTLFGYGPRYLHSTGQLHKGGADNGIFIVLSAKTKKDMNVPGQSYTFGQLEMAQALGDFKALDSRGRRAVYIHLDCPVPSSLNAFFKLVQSVM